VRWESGDTGKGRLSRFRGDMDPESLYGEYIRDTLRRVETLNPWTKAMANIDWPEYTFASVQKDGHALILNYGNTARTIALSGGRRVDVPAYGIARAELGAETGK